MESLPINTFSFPIITPPIQFQGHIARHSFLNQWKFGIMVEKIQEFCITCDISINDELVTVVNPMRKIHSYKNIVFLNNYVYQYIV